MTRGLRKSATRKTIAGLVFTWVQICDLNCQKANICIGSIIGKKQKQYKIPNFHIIAKIINYCYNF